MPFAKVNDIEIYFEVHGEGPPLLCVPGFANYSKTWLPYIKLLSKQFQLVLLDNRGAGQSGAPSIPYSVEMLADDAVELMDYLGIDSAYMVGSSMGCAIITTLALHSPERVKKGVLISPFAKLPQASLLKSLNAGKLLQAGAPLPLIIEGVIPWLYSNTFLSDPEKLNAIIEEMKNNPYPQKSEGFSGQLAALSGFNIKDRLPEITTPFLLLAGEEDLSTPLYCAEEMELLLPHGTLHSFPKMGHMAHHEMRKEVAHLISDFCN